MTDLAVFPETDIIPMTIEQWGHNLGQLWIAFDAIPWMIGDSLNEGLDRWGEQSTQYWPDGYSYGNVSKFAWVARKIPVRLRSQELSWSHHKIAAGLQEESDIASALTIAREDNLTCRQFAAYIRAHKTDLLPPSPEAIDDSRGSTDGLSRCNEVLAYTRERIGRTWSPLDQEQLEVLLTS